MGRMMYGARGMRVEMEDRLMAHVQSVCVSKLRRREAFTLSWTENANDGSGRRSIWMHDKLELVWEYVGSRPIELDRDTLERMAASASTNGGLDLGQHGHNPKGGQTVTPIS